MTKGNSMPTESIKWVSRSQLRKYSTREDFRQDIPYEVLNSGPNLLLTAGAGLVWSLVTGAGGTALNASNTYLAVGDGTTAAAVGQTDLVGTSKFRKLVDSTPTRSTNQVVFVFTFAESEAQFHWQEWGLANASSGGTLLNRFVVDRGTKGAEIWQMTITLSLT